MEQTHRPSFASIHELIEFGQFVAADQQLATLPGAANETTALRQFLLIENGKHRVASEVVEGLLARHLNSNVRCLCLLISGRADCIEGRTDRGLALFRQAVQLAKGLDDRVLTARAQGRLCHALLHYAGIEAVLPELSYLRHCGYSAGDARALTHLYCLIAEIELRQRKHAAAEHSLSLAKALCVARDLRMTAYLGRLRANAALLMSRPLEARRAVEPVIDALRENGATGQLVAALSTLGEACIQLGDYDSAERALRQMLSLELPTYTRVAALDSLMQIALACGDESRVFETQRAIDPLLQLGTAEYYSLAHVPTRARWLSQQGRAAEGVALLRAHEAAAASTLNAELTQAFGFAEVEALAALNEPLQAAQRLGRTASFSRERTLREILELNRLVALTRQCAPASFAERSERIRAIAFCSEDRHRSTQRTTPLSSPLEIAYSVAALFSVPLNGELLAHEVAVLLRAMTGSDDVSIATEPPRPAVGNDDDREIKHVVIDTGARDQPRYWVSEHGTQRADVTLAVVALQDLVGAAIDLGHARERAEPSAWLPGSYPHDAGMVVVSDQMRQLLNISRRVATSNVGVLFTGETGTGKELLARALHSASGRCGKPFVPFNCTAVSRDMLDSQLFGYRRGAFTGATESFQGVVRAAAGGTLFLDEVGEISLDLQPKLLRFLEAGEIHPLGEAKPINVDVRIVAATNADLEDLVAQGRFREDLFYRLNVMRLKVPPLRERREEIPLLTQHFLDKFSRESNKAGIQVADETMEYLILFRWPGNVRQLANEIHRLVAFTESGALLMPEHLSPEIAASRRTVPPSQRDPLPTEFTVRVDQPMSAAMEHVERSMIKYALEMSGDRLEDAARMLGLSRKGLYLKRQRLKMADAALPGEDAHKAAS